MKAYVITELFKHYQVGDIMDINDYDEWKGFWTGFTTVVSVPAELQHLSIDLLKAELVDGEYEIQKADGADQAYRDGKMTQVRHNREALLTEADNEINKIEDTSGDASAWRTYRVALRDVTEAYKETDGSWKSDVDSLDASAFSWPTKP